MNLALTDEQQMLRNAVCSFMEREISVGRTTNRYWNGTEYSPEHYASAVRAGWIGMLVPENFGGAGARAMDAAILYEAFGSAPLPAPAFSAGILVPEILLAGAKSNQQETLLPMVCDGSLIGALALSDQSTMAWGEESVETRLTEHDGSYELSGTKPFVYEGVHATHFIVAARSSVVSGISLVLVPREAPGVTVTSHADLLSSLACVSLDRVRCNPSAVIGEVETGWQAIEAACRKAVPVLGAMQVGACQAIFEAAVEYTRERHAFGQPIGRFQRVQDHVVELANQLDSARWITYETLWKVDRGDEAEAFVHECKAVASEAYYQVVNQAHKVYAGPGTDLDHPLMAHHVASRCLYGFLGDPAHHKLAMMDKLFPLA